MKILASAWLAWLLVAPASADTVLQPFTAEYEVHYGSIDVGSSSTSLTRGPGAGQWVIESRSTASGLARIIASGTLSQRSEFEVGDSGLRPLNYRFDDGTRRTSRDVMLVFDWQAGRVRGRAEEQPVDLAAPAGLQDAASIQARVQLALLRGEQPGAIDMIESDRVKRYRYTRLRSERLATALGELDTVVYRSARDRSSRETLFWYAPSLGYVMVRAEQRRDGKRAFQTYIRSFQPGD